MNWSRTKGYDKTVLTGRSLGGNTVIGYAATDKAISGVCTWAAVARLELLFNPYLKGSLNGPAQELIKMAGAEGTVNLKWAFFSDLNKHNLIQQAKAIAPNSLLIIHGTSDEAVPVEDARLLYEAANEPKKIALIEKADHRFSEHMEEVWFVFFEWLHYL